jgi:hypothetical protein
MKFCLMLSLRGAGARDCSACAVAASPLNPRHAPRRSSVDWQLQYRCVCPPLQALVHECEGGCMVATSAQCLHGVLVLVRVCAWPAPCLPCLDSFMQTFLPQPIPVAARHCTPGTTCLHIRHKVWLIGRLGGGRRLCPAWAPALLFLLLRQPCDHHGRACTLHE